VAFGFLAVALHGGRRDTAAEARDYTSKRLMQEVFPAADVLAKEAEEGIRKLIAYASEGNQLSHELLVEIADDLTDKHLSLPLSLQDYLIRPSYAGKRGRPRGSDWVQNAAIAGAVLALTEVNGFNRTRNRFPAPGGKANRRETACSVVAAEAGRFGITKTASAVEKISERYRELAALPFFRARQTL